LAVNGFVMTLWGVKVEELQEERRSGTGRRGSCINQWGKGGRVGWEIKGITAYLSTEGSWGSVLETGMHRVSWKTFCARQNFKNKISLNTCGIATLFAATRFHSGKPKRLKTRINRQQPQHSCPRILYRDAGS
jgi:hypothetical protein